MRTVSKKRKREMQQVNIEYNANYHRNHEAHDWLVKRKEHEIVCEMSIHDDIAKHLQINEAFDKLGWLPILQLQDTYYPELVKEFYCNMHDIGELSFKTWVRGTDITVNQSIIGELLGIPHEGDVVKFGPLGVPSDKSFPNTSGNNYDLARKEMFIPLVASSERKRVFKISLAPARVHVLCYLLCHNVCPRRRGYDKARNWDIYYLYNMVKKNTNKINLPPIIVNHMIAAFEDRVERGFYFPRLITKLLEKMNVSFEGATAIESKNILDKKFLTQSMKLFEENGKWNPPLECREKYASQFEEANANVDSDDEGKGGQAPVGPPPTAARQDDANDSQRQPGDEVQPPTSARQDDVNESQRQPGGEAQPSTSARQEDFNNSLHRSGDNAAVSQPITAGQQDVNCSLHQADGKIPVESQLQAGSHLTKDDQFNILMNDNSILKKALEKVLEAMKELKESNGNILEIVSEQMKQIRDNHETIKKMALEIKEIKNDNQNIVKSLLETKK